MKNTCLILLGLSLVINARAQVLSSDTPVDGHTQAEWNAEWWTWMYSISTNNHPALEDDGRHAHVNQPPGNVFYLTGVFGFSGMANRSMTAAENKHFFFPILNTVSGTDPGDPPTVEERREITRILMDGAVELEVSVDGVEVPDPWSHRVDSPVFSLLLDFPDNLTSYHIGMPIMGLFDNLVAGGYYLMVEPLEVGQHKIKYHALHDSGFELFITNHITIVQVLVTAWMDDMIAVVRRAPMAERDLDQLLQPLLRAHKAFAGGKTKPGINHLRGFQRLVERRLAPVNPALAADYLISVDRIIERAMRDL